MSKEIYTNKTYFKTSKVNEPEPGVEVGKAAQKSVRVTFDTQKFSNAMIWSSIERIQMAAAKAGERPAFKQIVDGKTVAINFEVNEAQYAILSRWLDTYYNRVQGA